MTLITREDAIKFLEGACRNWSKVPRLSNDDLQDVATELSRFVASRTAPSPQMTGNRGRIADAIEACDWSGSPIGNKEILKAAVLALRKEETDV